MAGSALVVQAIRAILRERGITYRNLADLMGVSEPTVKRDLGRGDFSLSRLDRICDVLGVTVEDLVRNDRPLINTLTELSQKQEAALVVDSKLLLITYLIVNDWRFSEMMSTFRIEENELISLLLKLDKLRVIEYRPPRRIKKLTARNFSWRKDGPVQVFFLSRVLPEFFNGSFEGTGDAFHFVGGTLSEASRARMKVAIAHLVEEFEQLARQDSRLPLDARNGCSAVIAIKKWEFSDFTLLRR
ncbi:MULTISPECIES: helix-turn-helix transcriptional regulator [unclassified Rhodanobacter]|uniref:helix-turn-helix domain-containing protein n=1 Tax=unclassified Rhodanobacter TaxID=2621553 RepID=UPI00160762BA|nr:MULTISPECIES: helix-turn-helix transcriptional regulator [unclassified Rhodanobacter]MBB6241819.1 DNA-binding Xre family transcriptional regulator [Rhodanobacter sp. MP1X3]MBB6246065.1 DNA-binding Xre family transcriptional regulator [Rhodanobacter sp. A1T4]